MLNIKHILFPVDFSERCCGAVPFVEAVASRYGAKVTLLSAAQPYYFSGMGDPGGAIMVDTEELLRDLTARLDNALTKEFSGLRVARVASLGDPAQVITEYADEHGVDLIMMPTHGYGPFRSLLLGSVTAKVLHDAKCPVWTAAHVAEPPSRKNIAGRNVLCAVDATPECVELIKWAGELAKDAEANLRLIHVVPGMEGSLSHQLDREFEARLLKDSREAIASMQKSAGLDVPVCVTVGDTAESVSEEARRHGADLVVIGRGVMHGALGRLRSHDYGIIRRSPCPVLSV